MLEEIGRVAVLIVLGKHVCGHCLNKINRDTIGSGLYPWHRHKDIRRYPWYVPQEIAADMAVVISCAVGLWCLRDMGNVYILDIVQLKQNATKTHWAINHRLKPRPASPAAL